MGAPTAFSVAPSRQNFPLPFRNGSAMTSHGGHQERFSTRGAYRVADSGEQLREASDSAASRGDGNALPRFHFLAQPRGKQPGFGFLVHPLDVIRR